MRMHRNNQEYIEVIRTPQEISAERNCKLESVSRFTYADEWY